MSTQTQDIMLSGIKPSSVMHLGNYLGALKNWVQLQKGKRCFFFAVDMHTITVPIDPDFLRENTRRTLALYLAAGIDPQHSTIFVQSHVHEHAELGWVLHCLSSFGELNRMTQFKDKSQQLGQQSIGAGLFAYPTLMAADILLYGTKQVPVGEDQKQHIELTRNLAERFNHRFGDTLVVPEPVIPPQGGRIMDLQDPKKKMSSSSQNPKGCVFFTDTDKEISKKIKSAVTDSGSEICLGPGKEGVTSLLEIQASISGSSIDDIVKSYEGKMYGHLKVDTAEMVVATMAPIRDRAAEILQEGDYLDGLLEKGAEEARAVAADTLKRVYDAIGFLPKK